MEIVFNVIVERDEEGFHVATVPEFRGWHKQYSGSYTLSSSSIVWRYS
jgi:hypothetical protein